MGSRAWLLALVLLAGCAGSQTPTDSCVIAMAEPDAPVLLEQRTEDPTTGPFIRRLSPDGTYREYSSFASSLRDGQIVTERVAPGWRVMAHLTEEQVARVEAALRDGFFEMPSEYRPPGTIADGYQVVWRACLDGREHTVTLHSVDASAIPELAAVRDAFALALAEATASGGSPQG